MQFITGPVEECTWWKVLPGQFWLHGKYPSETLPKEFLISQIQSGHKRTQSWLCSSTIPSMTWVPLTLSLCHAQDVSCVSLIDPKAATTPCIISITPTASCKGRNIFSYEKVSPTQTSPQVPLSKMGHMPIH